MKRLISGGVASVYGILLSFSAYADVATELESRRASNVNSSYSTSIGGVHAGEPSINEIQSRDTENNDALAVLESKLVTHWRVGSYGNCNKSCGGGQKYRSVTCPAGFQCTGTKPSSSAACNTHSCSIAATITCTGSGWSRSGWTCTKKSSTTRGDHNNYAGMGGFCYSFSARWDGKDLGIPAAKMRDWSEQKWVTLSDGNRYKGTRVYAGGRVCAGNKTNHYGRFYQISKETTQTKSASYTCPSGWRLSGSRCYR